MLIREVRQLLILAAEVGWLSEPPWFRYGSRDSGPLGRTNPTTCESRGVRSPRAPMQRIEPSAVTALQS